MNLLYELGILCASETCEGNTTAPNSAMQFSLDATDLLTFDTNSKGNLSLFQHMVSAQDTRGATAAKEKVRILKALTAETFYAVHPKAQRKVALPDSVDLSVPLNKVALNKLLSFDEPVNLSLQSLSFVHPVTYDEQQRPMSEDDVAISRILKAAVSASPPHETTSLTSSNASKPTAGFSRYSASKSHGGEDTSVYYLNDSSVSSRRGEENSIVSSALDGGVTL